MTCKDCIHFVACVDFWYSDYDCFDNIEQSKEKHANNEACIHFKPTADVVEVVRCKDCLFAKECFAEGDIYCRLNDISCGKDAFCSYGERKEK